MSILPIPLAIPSPLRPPLFSLSVSGWFKPPLLLFQSNSDRFLGYNPNSNGRRSKKDKQLLKAWLCRERQIYEMRKRAEFKTAVSELERP
ncbi:hypothetical protein SDJN02_03535, partial [Cucurbita argyrosperma subsp. argyrosperma]